MAANTTARSFPSDHTATGYNARNIALSTAESAVRVAELAAIVIDDLTDGDNDNRKAIRAAAEIAELSVHLTHTQWLVADGNLTEAKKSARNLVENGRKTE